MNEGTNISRWKTGFGCPVHRKRLVDMVPFGKYETVRVFAFKCGCAVSENREAHIYRGESVFTYHVSLDSARALAGVIA